MPSWVTAALANGCRACNSSRSSIAVTCATHAGFDAAGQPDLSIRDPFWEAYDGRFGQVVVGHTPRPQVERLGAIVLIDTGAVYGGCLSAYCPQTDAVVQVEGAATDAVLAGVGPC